MDFIFGFFPLFPFIFFFLLMWFGLRSVINVINKEKRSRHLHKHLKKMNVIDTINEESLLLDRTKSLQGQIFRLAEKKNGKLTLSDVIIQTGLDIETAEKLMDKMTDGQRIVMEVNNKGIVVYEFPEILARLEEKDLL
jgi:hypothetical protein